MKCRIALEVSVAPRGSTYGSDLLLAVYLI